MNTILTLPTHLPGNTVIAAKASVAAVHYIKGLGIKIDMMQEHLKEDRRRLKVLEDKMDGVLAESNITNIMENMNLLEDLGIPWDSNVEIWDFFSSSDGRVKKLTWYIMHLSGITDPPFNETGYARRILELLLTPKYRQDHYWFSDVE